MKHKIIIPRKDHEVYFIPMPEGFKSQMTQSFIFDKLSEMHPGFSATTRADIKTLEFNKKRWFMVTVIAGESLAEYRLMYKNVTLYTNTSIIVNENDFTSNGTRTIDDELIGFDSVKNEPVSVPLETANFSGGQSLVKMINNIPSGYGVFNIKKPKWLIAVILIGIMTLIFLPVAYTSSIMPNQPYVSDIPEDNVNQEPEKIYMPPAFVILANIAELFTNVNGEIDRWQFNENSDPNLIIQCKGISALTAHAVFDGIEYMELEDIRIVNYIENKPNVTISLRTKQDLYTMPVSLMFSERNVILSASAELAGLFNNQHITVVSEVLPSPDNGYEFYTINYLSNHRNLIYSIEAIEKLCEKNSLLIKRLDITASTDKRTFAVNCSLSYYNKLPDSYANVPDDKKHFILLAFGYKPERYITSPVIVESTSGNLSIIGTIRDSDGKSIYFYDSDGKIRIRSER
jgi:hypothetical protein